MGILSDKVSFGVKNIKDIPTNRGLQFQKEKPLTPYNFPLTQNTTYKIFGYKKDHIGIRRPHWVGTTIPTGRQLTPQMVGLDGFYSVKIIHQSGIVSPRKEQNKEFSVIPEIKEEENDTFIYSKNVINNRGYLKQNVARQ